MSERRRRAVGFATAAVNALLAAGIGAVPVVVALDWVGDVGWNRQAAVGVAMLASTFLASAAVAWGLAVRAPRVGGEKGFALATVLNCWIFVVAFFAAVAMWRDGRTDLLPFSVGLLVVVGANLAALVTLWQARGEPPPADG